MSRGIKWGTAIPGWILFGGCIWIILHAYLRGQDLHGRDILFISFLLTASVALFATARQAERIALLFGRIATSCRGFLKTMEFKAQQRPEGDDDAH